MFTIQDYVGEYTIRVGSLNPIGPTFEVGDKFYVGTDGHCDPPPSGDKVGVSIYGPDGTTRKFPADCEEPAYFEMSSGNLVYHIYDREVSQELLIQFTLVEVPEPMSLPFRTIYGAVIEVDPDVVGVWGADDQIP